LGDLRTMRLRYLEAVAVKAVVAKIVKLKLLF